MRLGIMQPYFFPYLGYYQLVNEVDHLVFLDDVKYIKNGWINRNQLISKQGKVWMTVRASQDGWDSISQVKTINHAFDLKKIRKTVLQNYSKARNFQEGLRLFDEYCERVVECQYISELAQESIKIIFEYLAIPKTYSCSASLELESSAAERVLDICGHYKVSEYVNPIGGLELYDKTHFNKHSVTLRFLRKMSVRPNSALVHWEDNGSMLDLIFHCDRQEIMGMLEACRYE